VPQPPPPSASNFGNAVLDNDDPNEVLVNDFDGQCCRTYPLNHSKIKRYRKQAEERRKKRMSSAALVTVKGEPEKARKHSAPSAATAAAPEASGPTPSTIGKLPCGQEGRQAGRKAGRQSRGRLMRAI
jgi:hypothetical protein